VSVIAAGGLPAALAVKRATAAIPVVFATGTDPVRAGLVTSLNRPGGNVTGTTFLSGEVVAKRVELLRELVPNVTTIALLVHPDYPITEPRIKEAEEAVHLLGLGQRATGAECHRRTRLRDGVRHACTAGC
jgi:putative tryptophan/tyrosine transport system substrate-binding protein